MFVQSLSKGSEEAQDALQRLTSFLEVEGASGRISPALQKKVLGKPTMKKTSPCALFQLYSISEFIFIFFAQMFYWWHCPTA